MITGDPSLDELISVSLSVPLAAVWLIGIALAAGHARSHPALSVAVGACLGLSLLALFANHALWFGIRRLPALGPEHFWGVELAVGVQTLFELVVLGTLVGCAAWGRASEAG